MKIFFQNKNGDKMITKEEIKSYFKQFKTKEPISLEILANAKKFLIETSKNIPKFELKHVFLTFDPSVSETNVGMRIENIENVDNLMNGYVVCVDFTLDSNLNVAIIKDNIIIFNKSITKEKTIEKIVEIFSEG